MFAPLFLVATVAAGAPAQLSELDCSPGLNIWQRTQQVNRAVHCVRLDQARANLGSRPALTLKWSQQVARSYPASREAQLLMAAAQFKLGKAQQSHQIFTELERTRPKHLAEVAPSYLWISAQAAVQAGDLAVARLRYRRLLLALNELPFEEQRALVLIEAAIVSLYTAQDSSEIKSYLERASDEEAPLLALLQLGLWQGLSEYLNQSLPVKSAPDLYLKVAWLLGIDADGETRPQTLVALPAGGRHIILAFLARALNLEQVTFHMQAISCGNLPLPAYLRQEFAQELARITCEDAEPDELEPWEETPPIDEGVDGAQ